MPTLTLICGLPGAGKTTLAKQLERETGAVRLCPDQWLKALLHDPNDTAERDRLRDPLEQLQWQLAQELLQKGLDVILENGFWSTEERLRYCQQGQACGAKVVLHYLEVPADELWRRVEARNTCLNPDDFAISQSELQEWLGYFTPPDHLETGAFDQVLHHSWPAAAPQPEPSD